MFTFSVSLISAWTVFTSRVVGVCLKTSKNFFLCIMHAQTLSRYFLEKSAHCIRVNIRYYYFSPCLNVRLFYYFLDVGAEQGTGRRNSRSCKAGGLAEATVFLWSGIFHLWWYCRVVRLWTNGLCHEGQSAKWMEGFLCSGRADAGGWDFNAYPRTSSQVRQ